MSKRIVIIGGVAGGMSCAARVKRLDDSARVTVFEKGPDVSYANCGMPYYVGGVIKDRQNLLVQTPQTLRGRYGIDIRVRHEALRIDRAGKQVEVRNLDSGEVFWEPYDNLVISTGAAPFRPCIPGADGPNVFVLNDLIDMDAINHAASCARSACVVGAGFIGLELVESFRGRGLEVHLVEMLDQVLPPMDWEMTQPLLQELRLNGVRVYLNDTVARIDGGQVALSSGQTFSCGFVCLAVGVRPTSALAREAGLDLGARGHIRVDSRMRTSDPAIYAVGDVVETNDSVTGERACVPLAGPANRQGRVAADNICGRDAVYPGTQGTSIVKVFGLAAAATGLSEKRLKAAGTPFRRVFLHPMQHPRYYPDAQPISIKLLFSPEGRIYGAQAVGKEGVDSTIDILATALRAGWTVEDLEHLELAYSPQWGGAKHGINMAGFTAANVIRGDVEMVEAEEAPPGLFWLDCRLPEEAEAGIIPGATVIPLDELRARTAELPRDREIGIYCAVGLRGYIGYRFLKQQGFRVRNLNGGYRTWCWYQAGKAAPVPPQCLSQPQTAAPGPCADACGAPVAEVVTLDVCGLQCPGPIAQVRKAVDRMAPGQVLEVVASDPGFAADIPMWCKRTGNTLVELKPSGSNYVARIARGTGAQAAPAPASVPAPARGASPAAPAGKTIVCFSDDLDKVFAAFIIANGAAAMGSPVTLFFTFWGLNVLRKPHPPFVAKSLLDRMFGWMMPAGPSRLKLSKMHMAGMGTRMMKHVMRTKNVMSLPDLIQSAREAGVRLVACSMSMDVMGIHRQELLDGVEIAGVGHYLGTADDASVNLFI